MMGISWQVTDVILYVRLSLAGHVVAEIKLDQIFAMKFVGMGDPFIPLYAHSTEECVMTVTTEMEMDVQVLASWSTAIPALAVMLTIEMPALKLVEMASTLGFFLVMMATSWMEMAAVLLAN
jgi:hypothetical protein